MARGVKARRRTRTAGRERRVPRVALLALALAYACLVGLSPVGHAGFLWLHLATEHHDAPARSGAEHLHDGGSANRHASADHGRGDHAHEHPVDRDEGRSAAPDAPHEHDGRLHTHDPPPAGDPAVPVDVLSKHYLLPGPASPPTPHRGAAVAPAAAPAPRQAAPPVETPPPRLPG